MIVPPFKDSPVRDAFAVVDNGPEIDRYSTLSNDELYEILCEVLPHMHRFSVNDLTRETTIAMLRVASSSHLL
jgi:hypothetical protein